MEITDQPATKGDLSTLGSDLRAEMSTLGSNLRAETSLLEEKVEILRTEQNHHYNDLVERISDAQTELLKAFYGYAQGNNKRVAELEGNEGAFRSRLATIEDRILEVERRLNMPPAN
jgi:predicted  nucleic acid-binding Zn-ribbon protein